MLASRAVLREGSFSLRYRANPDSGMARLGLVVPKRLARTAVMRNAIKRQGREAFRLLARSLPPCDIVVTYVKRGTTGAVLPAGPHIWRAEIGSLLEKIRVNAG